MTDLTAPVSVVRSITDQLSKGSVPHAQLGVSASTASVQVGDATETAAKVAEVMSGSAASHAGVRVGDAIIAVDDTAITSSESLVGYVQTRAAGDKVLLTIVRDGRPSKLTVQLGKAS